jgi:hypothetical protein
MFKCFYKLFEAENLVGFHIKKYFSFDFSLNENFFTRGTTALTQTEEKLYKIMVSVR